MSGVKAVVFDLVAGLMAAAVFIGLAATTSAGFDARKLCLLAAAAFFCAGLVRSRNRRSNTWLKSLLFGVPTAVVILVLSATGNAFTDGRLALTVALVTVAMAIAGIRCGQLWFAGARAASALVALVPVCVVLTGAVLVVPALMASSLGKTLDTPAPSFAMTGADGGVVESSRFKGHVVVLSFWATWCAPCRQELPQIERLAARYRGRTDVEFWAVGGPWGGDTFEREREYARRSGMALSLAFDGNRAAAQAMHVSAFPSLALLDQSGHVRFLHTGYDASDPLIRVLSDAIDRLAVRSRE